MLKKQLIYNPLIPFKGYNSSGAYNCNILLEAENIYVMDNHKMAYWCWTNSIPLHTKFNILHLDRHYDYLTSNIEKYIEKLNENTSRLNLKDFELLNVDLSTGKAPVFRFDNYLPIFIKIYKNDLGKAMFVTQKEGDKPAEKDFQEITEPGFGDLIGVINNIAEPWKDESGWIINLDFDFFFTSSVEGQDFLAFSKNYIEAVFTGIKKAYDNKHILSISIALSPEFCGDSVTTGWKNSLELLEIFNAIFKIDSSHIQFP